MEPSLEEVTNKLSKIKQSFWILASIGFGFVLGDVLLPSEGPNLVILAIYTCFFSILFGVAVVITSLQRLKQRLEEQNKR